MRRGEGRGVGRRCLDRPADLLALSKVLISQEIGTPICQDLWRNKEGSRRLARAKKFGQSYVNLRKMSRSEMKTEVGTLDHNQTTE